MVLTLIFSPLATLKSLKDTIVSAAHNAATFVGDKWLDAVDAITSIIRGEIDTAISGSPYFETSFKATLLSSINEGVNEFFEVTSYGNSTCTGMSIFYAEPKPISNTLYRCFRNCNFLMAACIVGDNADVQGYGTGRVTNFGGAFNGCTLLQAVDTENWDLSSATTIESMFNSCKNLKYVDVSHWEESGHSTMANITNIYGLFYGCSALTTLDVSNWNTSAFNTIGSAFHSCSALTTLDVSKWNVGNITNMSYAFYGCSALTTLDVSKWELPSNVNMVSAFARCSNLEEIDMSGWTCKLALQATFSGCTKLKSLDFRNMIVRPENIQNGLSSCVSLTSIKGLNLSNLTLTGENLTQTAFRAYSTYSAYILPSLTDCILEGTLYRYISIAYMPNLDVPSLRSWFDALYDWYKNEEEKTSYEVAYVSGNRGDMTSCPTFAMTLNQLARLDAAKTDASDGAGYYLMTALDKGWVFPDSITNSAVVEGYLEEYENYLLSL